MMLTRIKFWVINRVDIAVFNLWGIPFPNKILEKDIFILGKNNKISRFWIS